MKTAVIYIRVSSDRQVQGTSLATQEADCRTWCAKNDHTVLIVHHDDGESAKTADRPGLIAAVAAAKKADALVVWKLDRFSRNATDGLALRAALRTSGCSLVSATEPISSDPVGEMVGTILMAVAQLDNSVRAQRCRKGMESVALAGGWVHLPPAGFILDTSGRIPVLAQHPVTGPLIATALTDFASGSLDRAGFTSRVKSVGLSDQQACRILRSPVYAGIIRNQLTAGRDIPAAFPGLISPDAFWSIQSRIARPRQQHRKHRPEFSLVGVATCGVCGGPMKAAYSPGRNGKRYGYYDCRRGCVRSRVEAVDAAVAALLDTDLSGNAIHLRKLVLEEVSTEAEFGRIERDAATKRADTAEVRLSRLTDAYADGLIPAAEYRIKSATYRNDITENRMSAAASQISIAGLIASIDAIIALLSRPSNAWAKLDTEGRKMLIRTMFGCIIIGKNGECKTTYKSGVINELIPVNNACFSDGAPNDSAVKMAARVVSMIEPLRFKLETSPVSVAAASA